MLVVIEKIKLRFSLSQVANRAHFFWNRLKCCYLYVHANVTSQKMKRTEILQ